MPDKIYIIGHTSPDLDSVAAAIAFAYYKNQIEKTDAYVPAVAGEINRETAYVLDKFGFGEPERLESAAGKKLLLVDHNEFSQAVVGVEDAEIVGILDHHKLNFSYSQPIAVYIQPWGSSCSIIAGLMKHSGMEIPARLAGLMLSAALVDTVITKSPTCTDKDVGIIKMLAGQAGVDDWQAYGMEIFKVRSSVGELGADEIIQGDFKDFNFASGKFGIGQVETVDLGEFAGRYDELLEGLDKLRQEGGYHSTILFITDILKEGSRFLVSSSDMERVGQAFGAKFENSQAYLEGVMSRKKQVTPKLAEEFDK